MKILNPETQILIIPIANYIKTLDKNAVLDSHTLNEMSSSLARFIEMSTAKFIAGQKEHGGKITDKELEFEIENEMIDQFWYKEALFNWDREWEWKN